ncbi:MAG: cytochrome c [Gammaproteobacteria bacterium]|nr:cytochrome c [Gammaproteobacteria bacterium]
MLSVALAALLMAQGCAPKEPTAASQPAATPPPAAAPAEDVAATASDAVDEAAAPAEGEAAVEEPAAAGEATEAAAEAAPAAAAAAVDLEAGKKVYAVYCSTCHGTSGQGDGPAAAGLNPKPVNFAKGEFRHDANGNGTVGDIEDIKAIVHDGAAKYGGSPLMAPWPMISPTDLQAVAEYIKSLRS